MLARVIVAALSLCAAAVAQGSEDYDEWADQMQAGADLKAAAAAERESSRWWRFVGMTALGLASAAVIMVARTAAQRAARSQFAAKAAARGESEGKGSPKSAPAQPKAESPAARRGPGSGKRKKRAD